jgi:hypothetical protein
VFTDVQVHTKRKRAEEKVKIDDQLKKRKIELQTEFFKLKKNRKMALEIMDLERKLGVRPSETTMQYYPNESQLLILDSDTIMIGNDNVLYSST